MCPQSSGHDEPVNKNGGLHHHFAINQIEIDNLSKQLRKCKNLKPLEVPRQFSWKSEAKATAPEEVNV